MEKHREEYSTYKRNKYIDPQIKKAHDGRTYLTKIIRNKAKMYVFIKDIVGLEDRNALIKYLKTTIPKGYTFKDYGKGVGKLSIDHIKGCREFDLLDEEQYKACFNYKNLRLIPFEDNCRYRRV
jgi:hypothetical protein